MSNVSRPLVGLLVSTLAFFAIWTVALKPGGSTTSGGSQGLHAFSSAIAAAHHAAAGSAAASAAESGAPAANGSASGAHRTPAARAAQAGHSSSTSNAAAQSHGAATGAAAPSDAAIAPAVAPAHAATTPATAAPPASAAGRTGPAQLKAALAAHEVVVLLFYNPAGADDQAVKQELDAMQAPSRVLVLSAPIDQLAAYSSITQQVPVSQSPTLLFIDRHGDASALTGFSDSLEIAQRLADALAVK